MERWTFSPNPINTSGYNPLRKLSSHGQFIDDTQKNIINLNLTSDIKITNWLSMHTNFGFHTIIMKKAISMVRILIIIRGG